MTVKNFVNGADSRGSYIGVFTNQPLPNLSNSPSRLVLLESQNALFYLHRELITVPDWMSCPVLHARKMFSTWNQKVRQLIRRKFSTSNAVA